MTTRIETNPDATDTYLSHVDQPYGREYAETVGRFQEGFLRDKVSDDLDEAFALAVDAAERLLPAIKTRADVLRVAAARA